MQCPRCERSVSDSSTYCPHCQQPQIEGCWRCEGTGIETSTVSDWDGSERIERRVCHFCGGNGTFARTFRVDLKTGRVEVFINGRNIKEMPPLGSGW